MIAFEDVAFNHRNKRYSGYGCLCPFSASATAIVAAEMEVKAVVGVNGSSELGGSKRNRRGGNIRSISAAIWI